MIQHFHTDVYRNIRCGYFSSWALLLLYDIYTGVENKMQWALHYIYLLLLYLLTVTVFWKSKSEVSEKNYLPSVEAKSELTQDLQKHKKKKVISSKHMYNNKKGE